MNAKKIGLALIIAAVLSIALAQSPFKGLVTQLPKPVPPTCPSDLLCW